MASGQHDPGQRLADPEHPQGRRHRLQPAGGAQVDGGRSRERDRPGGHRDLAVAGRQGEPGDQSGRGNADADGQQRAAVDQAAQRGRAVAAAADGHVAHGRQIHAEAAASGGHERDLHGDGHQAQPGPSQVAPHQDLDAEGCGHARHQPGDVHCGARQQGALVAHVGIVFLTGRRSPPFHTWKGWCAMGAVIVISLFVLFLVAAVRDGVDSREWRPEGWWPGSPR
jgi:hypothetical protein